jgi:hypothetical protein
VNAIRSRGYEGEVEEFKQEKSKNEENEKEIRIE